MTGGSERGPGKGGKWIERAIVLGACALIACFYVWTARTEGVSWNFGQRQTDYYNLLVDGFLDGQLYMKAEVPEAITKLADPYNPANRPPGVGLHDASMYQGHYYLYFGAAPVVTLILPFRLLTGTGLPLPAAVLIFTLGGFLGSVALFGAIRRRYFPEGGLGLTLLTVLALGTASMTPLLVLRGSIWELPTSGGYCWGMFTLLCVWRSLWSERRATAWFALAGLCLGLAVASRPTYLYTSGLLALPLLWWWRQARNNGASGLAALPWRRALAAAVPLGAVGLAMAWYNYARFGSPTEFGVAYQFSGVFEAQTAHFRWSYTPINLRMYWTQGAEWSRYFPFFHLVEGPSPLPAGYIGHDEIFGALIHVPLVWLALCSPLALWRRTPEERGPLVVMMGALAVIAAAMVISLAVFYAAMVRYGPDYLPALVLLAGIGMLAVQRWLRAHGARRGEKIFVAGAGGVAVWSIAFAVLLSFVAYGNLKRQSPQTYARLAKWANAPTAWLERLREPEHGPMEIELRWPATWPKAGTRELLVSTGGYLEGDHVFAQYEEAGRLRIGYLHDGGTEELSRPLAVAGGAVHKLRVELGALYPPEEHAYFDGLTPAQAERLARRLRVALDGEVLLDRYQRFHKSSPADVYVGRARYAGRPELGFSGEIVRVSRDHDVAAVLAGMTHGAEEGAEVRDFSVVRMTVRFPEKRGAEREPLVVTGDTGRGDFLFVEYLDGGQVRFGVDHWGKAPVFSAPLTVDWMTPHVIEIALESFPGATTAKQEPKKIAVKLDGREVWAQEARLFAVEGRDVFVGRNPIGGTGCAPRFTGTILEVKRERKPDSVR